MIYENASYGNYVSIKIKNSIYIMPYGQNIADFKNSYKINDSGYHIWKGFCLGKSDIDICKDICNIYDIKDEERSEVLDDVKKYTEMFKKITSSDNKTELNSIKLNGKEDFDTIDLKDKDDIHKYFKTGPLIISYEGPKDLFENYFKKFEYKPDSSDKVKQNIKIIISNENICLYGKTVWKTAEENVEQAEILINNKEVLIQKLQNKNNEFFYRFYFKNMKDVFFMDVTEDGSNASIYCGKKIADKEDIFHMIRFAYIICAQNNRLFLFHSASLLYKDKVWLFSGMSGAGKSTHTGLWKKYYGVDLINGDLNMIGFNNGRWVVYGQPWCGTSGIASSKDFLLGGITFIQKADHDKVIFLDEEKSMLKILQRLISPTWEINQILCNVKFSDKISNDISVMQLECTKNKSAADEMKRFIDDNVLVDNKVKE